MIVLLQVKEKREKRQQQLEQQRREKQAKKEAQFQARQLMKQVRAPPIIAQYHVVRREKD